MTITKEMIDIASFDLLPTDWMSDILWDYFPESEPFSINFETAGIEAKLFLENVGLAFYIVLASIILGLLHFILRPFRNFCDCLLKMTKRMESFLYFNGTIRFYTEIFFDVCLQAALNLHTIEWVTPFFSVNASNSLSVVFIVLVCIFPFCTILVSCLQPKLWTDE